MKSFTAKSILGTFIAGATYFLGEWDAALNALIILIIADYVTGLIAAYYNNNLSSKTGMKGIVKKVLYLCIVLVANIIDGAIQAGGWVREMVIFFLVANESLSILENAAKCGLPIPKFLLDKLNQLRGEANEGKEL